LQEYNEDSDKENDEVKEWMEDASDDYQAITTDTPKAMTISGCPTGRVILDCICLLNLTSTKQAQDTTITFLNPTLVTL